MSTVTQRNPYERGLFVTLSGDEAKAPPPTAITIRGTLFDMAPYLGAVNEIGTYLTQFGANPLDARALMRMQQVSKQLRPALAQHMNHPVLKDVVKPLAQSMSRFLANSQQLIGMRLKTSYKIARAPKILVPICLSIASGASTTGIQIRNPYLGATGGISGQYQSAWAITSFRTSNNESGQLSPIRLTDFTIGGHNFVAAALAGLTYSAGGAPATLGWPAAAFAETKRSHWATEVQPWNVIAQHAGATGFGSVMTETGFFQLAVFNGGSQTYVDTYSVYCNATLCGNPYLAKEFTQADAFKQSFKPLAQQLPLALQLAGEAQGRQWALMAGLSEDDGSMVGNPYHQAAQSLKLLGTAANRILDMPSEQLTVGDDFLDPREAGMQLADGYQYADT